MAKRSHRRASNLPSDDDYQPGCMRGIFRLWRFQLRFRNQKRISGSRRLEEPGRFPSGSKYSKLNNYEHLDIESNPTQVEIYGEEDAGKLCSNHPLSPRLTRTLSIHHLECNDYVEWDQIEASDLEHQNAESIPPRTGTLLDAKVENLIGIDQNPDYLGANRFGSYPLSSILGRSDSYPRDKKKSGRNSGDSITPFSSNPSLELRRTSQAPPYKDVKERLRDLTNDPTKENRFITMDGILDKIPYGRSSSHDSTFSFNRTRWRSRSMRVESPAADEMRVAIPCFSRSRSLTDPSPPSNSDPFFVGRSTDLNYPFPGMDADVVLDRCSSKQEKEAEQSIDADIHSNKTGNLSPPSVLEDFEDGEPTSPVNAQSADSPAAVESPDKKSASREAYWVDELHKIDGNERKSDLEYIMEVLVRTGFQHTFQLPLSPTAFKELEGLSLDSEICSLDNDIDLNHLLLFDLVNEILMEMHESSSTPFSWRSFFDFNGRSFSTSPHCLRIFWASVRRCLGGSSSHTDLRISRDLDVKDGWTNPFPNFEVEDVGMELEDIILDDLVDQLILSFLN